MKKDFKEEFCMGEKAEKVKTYSQYAVGAIIIIITFLRIIYTLFSPLFDNFFDNFLKYVITQPFLDIISQTLLFSTAIELGFMLFTPGPDEAVDPIITGLAAFILTLMAKDPIELINVIGIGVSIGSMICVFWIKEKYFKKHEPHKTFKIINHRRMYNIDLFMNIDFEPSTLKFMSTDENVAEINENGLITIKGNGMTEIKVFHKEYQKNYGSKFLSRIKLNVNTATVAESHSKKAVGTSTESRTNTSR